MKEFLTSEKTFAIMKTFYVGGDDVEAELAKTCLTYLNFDDFITSILSSRSDLDRMLHQYRFLAHAAQSGRNMQASGALVSKWLPIRAT